MNDEKRGGVDGAENSATSEAERRTLNAVSPTTGTSTPYHLSPTSHSTRRYRVLTMPFVSSTTDIP